ncbi:unnamed protein product [Rotaria sp. Silwood1]|nr:unnamed protein product [Rotaria sp. Silwood1]CAF0983959.1 unnamed protein product [Rotaria sp. Silwood1]CAF0992725.1 unnamed protein product [Rotaria sp. Silwood1]
MPCMNNGTCYQGDHSYLCICPGIFDGENCETMNFSKQCPLDCSPGQCIVTGDARFPYLCSCNGTLYPNSCKGK